MRERRAALGEGERVKEISCAHLWLGHLSGMLRFQFLVLLYSQVEALDIMGELSPFLPLTPMKICDRSWSWYRSKCKEIFKPWSNLKSHPAVAKRNVMPFVWGVAFLTWSSV